MPSKPAGNSNQTTTSTQSVQLPDWVNNASQQIWGQAGQVANNLQPAVAPLTGGQNAGIQALMANLQGGQPQYAQAGEIAGNIAGYAPQQVTPGFLSGTNLAPYMNPYTQSVINPSIQLLEQGRATSNQGIDDAAARTGAFAGSRQGVSEGVNNAQTNLLEGQLGAQLNSANFNNAQQQAQTDLARSLQGQALNQSAGLQGQQLNLGAANLIGQLGTQSNQTAEGNLLNALQGQGLIQQNQQQQMTAQQQNPINQLQILLSAIGGVPYGHTQTGTQTGMGPVSNPGLTALGGLGALAGIGGSIFGGPLGGAIGGAFGGLLGGGGASASGGPLGADTIMGLTR